MKLKYVALLCCLAFIGFSSYAQEDPEPVKGFDKSKLFFGGNFGMGFGSSTTSIILSPQAGYHFNRYFAAGAGINGQYSSYRTRFYDGSTAAKESYTVLGLNIFGRAYPIRQVFFQVQPEANYIWGKYKDFTVTPNTQSKLDPKVVPSLLLGLGGAIPAGNGAFVVIAQYDVLQNDRSIYGNKVFFSFGYNIGL